MLKGVKKLQLDDFKVGSGITFFTRDPEGGETSNLASCSFLQTFVNSLTFKTACVW